MITLPKVFSQFDLQWNDQILGFNTDKKYNFHNYACRISTLAMIAWYFGKQETPLTINTKLKEVEGYEQGTGNYISGSITKIFPDIKETAIQTPYELTDDQMATIKQSLDRGFPVVFGIDYNPKTLDFDSHYVVAIGYNPKDENDFTVADSLGGRIHSLKDYLGEKVKTVRQSVWQYFLYEGQVPVLVQPQVVTEPVQGAQVSPLPENFSQIMHGSDQWNETVKYYIPEVAPEVATMKQLKDKLDANPIIKVETVEVIKEVEKLVPAPAVEIPVAPTQEAAPPMNFPHAVRQWADLVAYLSEGHELKNEPDTTTFENVRRVIAGIKAKLSEVTNQKNKINEEIAKRDAIIENYKEEISRLNTEVITQKKLAKAREDALKKSTPDFSSLVKQYDGIIEDLKGELKAAVDKAQALRIEVSIADVVKETPESKTEGVTKTFSFKPFELVKKVFSRVFFVKW